MLRMCETNSSDMLRSFQKHQPFVLIKVSILGLLYRGLASGDPPDRFYRPRSPVPETLLQPRFKNMIFIEASVWAARALRLLHQFSFLASLYAATDPCLGCMSQRPWLVLVTLVAPRLLHQGSACQPMLPVHEGWQWRAGCCTDLRAWVLPTTSLPPYRPFRSYFMAGLGITGHLVPWDYDDLYNIIVHDH